MEFKNYIKTGIEKSGTATELAKQLDQNPTVIRNAKAHQRGLPVFACIKLAKLIDADPMAVIAASELVMEKNEARRAVLLPFVAAKKAQTNAQNTSTPTNASAEMQTAPKREPSEIRVAKRGIEPRTRGFSVRCSTN